MITCLARSLGNNRGFALLVTLGMVAILAAGAFEVGRRVNTSADRSMGFMETMEAEQMALAGIHLAMAALEEDASGSEIDSVQEAWNDPLLLAAAVDALDFPEGNITLTISDELGKLQVNALIDRFPGNAFNEDQRELWERLLGLVISGDKSLDIREPAAIINCIKDWLDAEDDDTITGISGAENAYYRTLEPPVECSNGPIDAIDELKLIKGVGDDLLSMKELFAQESPDGDSASDFIAPPPLDDILTVFGMDETTAEKGRYSFPGTININTAGLLVLMAMLPPGLEDQAQELISYREQKEEDGGIFVNTLDKGWYERVIELSDKEKEDLERIVRYSSSVFRVECRASKGNGTCSVRAVVKRRKDKKTNAWTCSLLRFEKE